MHNDSRGGFENFEIVFVADEHYHIFKEEIDCLRTEVARTYRNGLQEPLPKPHTLAPLYVLRYHEWGLFQHNLL
jgi:hypothetical protein